MSPEWERLYREAIEELDAEKIPEICERARRSINDRLIELAAQSKASEKERERLFEALRQLLIHEKRQQAPS